MWDTAKVVFREKFIALNVYIRKEEKSKFNDLIFHFRKLGRKDNVTLKQAEKERNNKN